MKPLTGPVLTAAETRSAEQAAMAAGVSVDTLMERAGLALARAVWRFGGGRRTLILCGPGNNGGDGYVAARLLQSWGVPVRLAALLPPATDVAKRAAAQWSIFLQWPHAMRKSISVPMAPPKQHSIK